MSVHNGAIAALAGIGDPNAFFSTKGDLVKPLAGQIAKAWRER